MSNFKKGIISTLAGGFLVAVASSSALAQGAATLVQPVVAGAAVSSGNPLPVTGSFSASVSGFIPSLSYTTLTATAASSASTALPTNTGTVAFQNQTSVAVSCTLASGSATALTNEVIVPAGNTIFVGTTGYDHAACINQTGSASNVIVLAGGTGLGTGFGGSSGAVFGPTAVGSANANPPVVIGGTLTGTAGQNVSGAAVKAASTQAAATDTSLVVQENPNGPLIANIQAGAAPVAAGAATATTAALTGGQYLSTQPTMSNGWQVGTLVSPRGAAYVVPGVEGFAVNTAQVNGVTVLTGTGATGTGAQRVTVSTDQATNAGAALVKGGVGVVNGGSFYVTVAASQTAQVLQSSTGAAGDYLSHCVIQPTTTAAGTVTILDNSTTIFTFTTGTLSNLVPFTIPVGALSTSGAWKVTTGANETVTCVGKFS